MQSVVVLEANEIPLRVFKEFRKRYPDSTLSMVFEQATVLETIADDVEDGRLYPSQTWASMNTGVDYKSHQIHWYNDPKPQKYPLNWKILADNGISVGLVNALHSSPATEYFDESKYKFLLPDCFAVDNFAYPSYLSEFQSLNLKSTELNTRVSTMKLPIKDIVRSIPNIPKYGIRRKTVTDTISTFSKILTKKIGKERLRNLQFPIIADIFIKQLNEQKPNFSVLFTNHVAASMHRYWYGLFPDDWSHDVYTSNWLERYSCEVLSAMQLLDYYLKALVEFVIQNDFILVIATSMGQSADLELPEGVESLRKYDFRLENVDLMIAKLVTSPFRYKIESAMVPQYSLEFDTHIEAERFSQEVKNVIPTLEGIKIRCDLNCNIVTLSIFLDEYSADYVIKGKKYKYSDLGFARFKIDDHRSGKHSPQGSLVIFNSRSVKFHQLSIDYLEYAPALLEHFDVDCPTYMLEPSFTF